MTQMLNRPADPTARSAAPTADDRVLPRFDAVAAEPPAESLRREREVLHALQQAGPSTPPAAILRAGAEPEPGPAAYAAPLLSRAMSGGPIGLAGA